MYQKLELTIHFLDGRILETKLDTELGDELDSNEFGYVVTFGRENTIYVYPQNTVSRIKMKEIK